LPALLNWLWTANTRRKEVASHFREGPEAAFNGKRIEPEEEQLI
jgi:hypothetical protein